MPVQSQNDSPNRYEGEAPLTDKDVEAIIKMAKISTAEKLTDEDVYRMSSRVGLTENRLEFVSLKIYYGKLLADNPNMKKDLENNPEAQPLLPSEAEQLIIVKYITELDEAFGVN
jgi:hypothetical protein